jgi:hypothetical protein
MDTHDDNLIYSESGVDQTLLRENLRRSLAERWEHNSQALPALEELRRSGRPATAVISRRTSVVLDIPGLLRGLSDHQVEYVVIGGMAMIAHGSAYVTRDLDVCYSRTAANVAALTRAIAPLHPSLRGAPPGLPFRFDEATIQAGLNFMLTTDLGDVDLLGEVTGLGGYEQVRACAEEREVFGLKIPILGLDGLITAKKAAGRPKDLLQLQELQELKKQRDAKR